MSWARSSSFKMLVTDVRQKGRMIKDQATNFPGTVHAFLSHSLGCCDLGNTLRYLNYTYHSKHFLTDFLQQNYISKLCPRHHLSKVSTLSLSPRVPDQQYPRLAQADQVAKYNSCKYLVAPPH